MGGGIHIQLVDRGRGLCHKVRFSVFKQYLWYEKEPVEFLDHDVQKLRTCEKIILDD